MGKLKALDGLEYYSEQELSECKDSLNEEFDNARLTAESGLARMYEITYKRASSLQGWKLTIIRQALKAAFKLIHKL